MTIKLENTEWTLEEEYKNGFDLEALKERYTDYFEPYALKGIHIRRLVLRKITFKRVL